MYYRSTNTGKIFSKSVIRLLKELYGRSDFVVGSILIPVSEPNMIDCVKYGSGSVAVQRYRELHPDVSVKDAYYAVKKIREDIKELQSKQK